MFRVSGYKHNTFAFSTIKERKRKNTKCEGAKTQKREEKYNAFIPNNHFGASE